MYNQLFGINEVCPIALSILDLDIDKIERFRDTIIVENDLYGYVVEILTRTGGENRTLYPNYYLLINPNLIKDFDDEYDNTYHHYIFKTNSDNIVYDMNKVMEKQTRKSLNLKEMFEEYFKNMEIEGTKEHEQSKRVAKNLEKLIDNKDGETKILFTDDLFK